MNKTTIAIAVVCLGASQLMAQRGGARGGNQSASGSHPVAARTNFGVRNLGVRQHAYNHPYSESPYYGSDLYDDTYSGLDGYGPRGFYTSSNGVDESDPPQPSYMNQPPEPPPPPVTPVLHEYSWPKEVNTPAPFSIVTTDGTEYLANMVWVQEGEVHFNPVEGDTAQLPLSSVSRSLTQAANARKNLDLHLQ